MMICPAPADRDAVNLAVYERQQAAAWRGWPMDKCAQDILAYQEIVAHLRPAIIVETGTWHGGSALFWADLCELNGGGRVLSIDVAPQQPLPGHPRLTYLVGDSVAPDTIRAAHDWAAGETGLVILDSDHRTLHVLAELDAYSDLVAESGYLIVEDTNVGGHPVRPDFGLGPYEAVQAWLARTPAFQVDHEVEPFVTFAPQGYLRPVSEHV